MKKILLIGILTMILLAGIVSATTNDAVLYYSFDDGDYSGTTMVDVSGITVHNGTCTGMGASCNTLTTGILGNSSSFDAVAEYIDAGIEPDFGMYGNYTISAWVNTTATFGSNAMYIARSDNAANHGYNLHFTSSEEIELHHTGSGGSNIAKSPSGGYNDGAWHHTVATFNTKFGSMLWVDGVNVANSTTTTSTISNNVTAFQVGGQDAATPRRFNGYVDEVALYDRLLTNAEIAELYNSGTGYNPYKSTATNATVTITDEWNGNNINNISVIIDGTTYTNTTGNKITTKIWTNDTSLYTVNITANNYFGKNYTNQNFTADVDLAATLHQSEIFILPYELYSNNSIANSWCIMNGTTQKCRETQWNITAGTYNVTVFNSSNYYNITKELTINILQTTDEIVEGLYDVELNVSLRANPYNTSVTTGTGWLYHQNATYNYTISSTPTTSTIPWLAGSWQYYLQAEIDGINGYYKNTSGTSTSSNGSITKLYYLQNDYLQLSFINNTEGAANTTGRIIFEDLTNYTSEFNSTPLLSLQKVLPIGYVNVYFNTKDNWTQYYEYYNDHQTIYNETLQLLENKDKQFFIKVIDQNGQAVNEVRVRVYHSDTTVGSYEDAKLIGQRYTENGGRSYFLTDADKPIWIQVEKTGYDDYTQIIATGDVTTSLSEPYVIRVQRSLSGYDDSVLVHHQKMYSDTTTLRVTIQAFDKTSIKLKTNASNYTGTADGMYRYTFDLTNGTDYTTGTAFNFTVYVDGTEHGIWTVELTPDVTNELLNNITFPKLAVVIAILVLTLLVSIVFRAEGVGFTTFTILGGLAIVLNSAFWLMSTILILYYGIKWIRKLITE